MKNLSFTEALIVGVMMTCLATAIIIFSKEKSLQNRIKETCKNTGIYDQQGQALYDCNGVSMGDL